MRCISRSLQPMLLVLTLGCATNPVPEGWLATPGQSQVEGFGGWITVTTAPARKQPAVEGELISVSPDALVVLTNSGPVEVQKTAVARAVVDGYEQDTHAVRRAWLIVSLASISDGGLFAIPAGLWAVAGSTALREAWSYARVVYPGQPWEMISKYARFPQGLPAGLDTHRLQQKPYTPPAGSKPRNSPGSH